MMLGWLINWLKPESPDIKVRMPGGLMTVPADQWDMVKAMIIGRYYLTTDGNGNFIAVEKSHSNFVSEIGTIDSGKAE
jgi:hypothetical protein